MDAIVLVGGQGMRLRPLTARRHKSLVPVANRPAIDLLLDWLEHAGIARAVLALGVQNDDLAAACPAGPRGTLGVVHVVERERLESGGAIRNAVAEAGIQGRFVVVNGDVFTDLDLREALAAHVSAGAELTMALSPVDEPSAFGVAVVGPGGLIERFVEKPPPGTEPSNLVNAGVWIFEAGLVGEIPPGAVRVEDTLFPILAERGRRMLGHVFDGLWVDIGTAERYRDLNVRLARAAGGTIVAEGAIMGDATLEESVIGAGSWLGRGATVRRSVLWEHVRVEAGATVEDSVLADAVTVGAGANVSAAVIGAGATVAPGSVVPAGTVLDAGARYHPGHGS